MRRLALTANPTADWEPEEPFPAEYRCMWCSFPRPGEPGLLTDTQHKDRSTMYISGKDRAWIFLYEKLPEKTTQRARYTDKDIEEFAAKFADYPIDEKLYVRDVFNKSTAGMANLEEGVSKHWSWGRMVLMGDACHKFTPNAGRGYNNGVQDVIALANRLQGALKSSKDGILDNATLAELFADYQRTRTETLKSDASISAHVTRLHAWSNTIYYIFARYIVPWGFVQKFIMNQLSAPQIANSLILDYVPAEEPFKGLIPWKNAMPSVPLDNKD
jgi:2-polyprenyl-6-methoxyphenol hydroxylase-like FAD-dependent oxidoreductase